ncbi:DUF4145 domain-containing protein [Vibrio scophthalmi]|uniref:DUF4145 domain-containing protein n=1 Tax=Vibrio scophthalmi TaxID=45658 RepID=UPI0038730271
MNYGGVPNKNRYNKKESLVINKIHCNTCGLQTNHKLISSHNRSFYEEDDHEGNTYITDFDEWKYNFWVCLGCDTGLLEVKHTCMGMQSYEGDKIYDVSYFPSRKNISRLPKHFRHIDSKLNSVYNEIIQCFQLGLGVATAMSIRALLEGICIHEGITDQVAWKFEVKIDKLHTISGIPESITDGLKNLKFIGDDAAHRLVSPNRQVLSLAIDLLEALLTHVYEAKFELHNKAELIKIAGKL